jgi:hypothetical protein
METVASLHHERFFSLLDAGEACIKYTGAMAIALSITAGRPFDLAETFRQPPSLGRWAQIIRESLRWQTFPNTLIANALKSSLMRPNGQSTPAGRYLLDEFVNVRNTERGHASSLPDAAYERLHLRHATELHDALGACKHITYPLVRIESVDVVTEPFSYDVRLLVGPPPLTRTERIQAETRIRQGSACGWDRSDTLLDLGEIVIYRTCPVCNLAHSFFLERMDENYRHYHSYVGNHRLKECITNRGA